MTTNNATVTSAGFSNITYTIPNILVNDWGVSGTISVDNGHTPSGTQSSLKLTRGSDGAISPRLYVKYLKSKLTKVQKERLKSRIGKLQKLVLNAHDMGQISLYENLSKMLAVLIRESEACACGVDTYLDRQYIDKYMHKVQEKPVKFESLEKFPRTIPLHIRKKIKQVQESKLFDRLDVLYMDYTGEDTRSNKDKIRDKDPILFGSYSFQPHRFYFIADWMDEYCDITLDKFVEKIKEDDPNFGLAKVPDVDEEFFEMIKKEVKDRQDRLDGTKRDNFRENMQTEDAARAARDRLVKNLEGHKIAKKPWYKRVFGKRQVSASV